MFRLPPVIFSLAISASAFAESPCDGQITDKLDHPLDPAAVSKPTPGGSYVDPVFGNLITRISHSDATEGDNAITRTLYNTMRGWNADETLIVAWDRGSPSHYEIYQGDKPYGFLCTLGFDGTYTVPGDIEELFWDPVDPNVLFYPAYYTLSGYPNPRLMKVTLTDVDKRGGACDRVIDTVRVFDAECADYDPFNSGLRQGSDPHDMALAGGKKYMGFLCGSTSTPETRMHLLYSITDDEVVGSYASTNTTAPWPLPSGTGAYRTEDAAVYDLTLTRALVALQDMGPTGEHAALASTAAGYDTYNQVNFSSPVGSHGTLISWRLSTGTATQVIGTPTWPYPKSGTHISLGNANGDGWVAISSVGTNVGTTLLENELLMANVYTGEVCRVAHLRSDAGQAGWNGPWGYWGEPHPQISNDGYRVLYNSDWMASPGVDIYVLDLRPQDVTIPPGRGLIHRRNRP